MLPSYSCKWVQQEHACPHIVLTGSEGEEGNSLCFCLVGFVGCVIPKAQGGPTVCIRSMRPSMIDASKTTRVNRTRDFPEVSRSMLKHLVSYIFGKSCKWYSPRVHIINSDSKLLSGFHLSHCDGHSGCYSDHYFGIHAVLRAAFHCVAHIDRRLGIW